MLPRLATHDEFSSPRRSLPLPPPGGNNHDKDDDVDDFEDGEHEGDNDPPTLCPWTKRFVSSGDAVTVYWCQDPSQTYLRDQIFLCSGSRRCASVLIVDEVYCPRDVKSFGVVFQYGLLTGLVSEWHCHNWAVLGNILRDTFLKYEHSGCVEFSC